jgi:hypothetical protein
VVLVVLVVAVVFWRIVGFRWRSLVLFVLRSRLAAAVVVLVERRMDVIVVILRFYRRIEAIAVGIVVRLRAVVSVAPIV